MYCEDQKTLAKQTNAVPLFSSKFFSWKLPAAQVMYSLAWIALLSDSSKEGLLHVHVVINMK